MDGIDWLTERLQEPVIENLIAFGAASAGVIEPPRWNGGFIQALHYWRVTAAGRADAKLYRDEVTRPSDADRVRPSLATAAEVNLVAEELDVFISHAGEDKTDVARPLCEALTERGWSVWPLRSGQVLFCSGAQSSNRAAG